VSLRNLIEEALYSASAAAKEAKKADAVTELNEMRDWCALKKKNERRGRALASPRNALLVSSRSHSGEGMRASLKIMARACAIRFLLRAHFSFVFPPPLRALRA
jgi:hypothetical protein